MKENKDDYYSLSDIKSHIKLFLKYLLRRWWLVLLAILIGSCLGYIYYNTQKPKYDAQCTFIIEEKQSSMGGLGSIASQFGFDLGGVSGGGSIFAGDNILDILKSKKIVQQVLLTPVDNKLPDGKTLADLFLEFSNMKKKWEGKPELININFFKSQTSINNIQDSVLNIIYETVITKNLTAQRSNKKGTIIKVDVTAPNDLFAKLATERLVDEASKMYLTIKTGTAQENIYRMQRRSDSLLSLLNYKSYRAAISQPLDANPGLKAAIVPTEIAMRDKTVIATLYTEVTKNLEASKLLLSQQTPIIQILDRPGLSLYDNKKTLLYLVFAFSFIAVVICFLLISAIYFFRRIVGK